MFKYYFSNTWTGLGRSRALLCSSGVEIELSPYIDGGINKSHVITAVAYIWSDFSVIQCLQVYSINMSSIEAELMVIQTGLIPTMAKDNIHDIIVIIDSISIAKKFSNPKSILFKIFLFQLHLQSKFI